MSLKGKFEWTGTTESVSPKVKVVKEEQRALKVCYQSNYSSIISLDEGRVLYAIKKFCPFSLTSIRMLRAMIDWDATVGNLHFFNYNKKEQLNETSALIISVQLSTFQQKFKGQRKHVLW